MGLRWSCTIVAATADYVRIVQLRVLPWELQGFPDSSVGKESACNTGDLGSIPGAERSAGEETGYSLQYSWDSLVIQLVKNPSAMWET